MPEIYSLSPEQIAEFVRRGVVCLPGFYSRNSIDVMADRLWEDLERRFGIDRDRPESWTVAAPAQFQALKQAGAFNALASPELFALADTFLGAGEWDEPASWGAPLVTFPTPNPERHHSAWHLDIGGVKPLTPLPILRSFTFLEPVLGGGGGTLYVAGTHLLALEIERELGRPVRSADVRERLKSEDTWLRNLLSVRGNHLRELMEADHEFQGHKLRLEEMTGQPGDLVIMHPAVLHGSAPNTRERPRMMLTSWIYRSDKME